LPASYIRRRHPERYREYSHKVHDVLTSFFAAGGMASVDEAYLDITGTDRLYGPAAARRASVAPAHESRDQSELLDRDRLLAAGG